MLEPSYRKALARSWALVWHHKILWVLGLLSVFVGELGLSNFLGQLWAKMLSPTDSWWPSSWGQIHIGSAWEWLWFLWLAFIVATLVIFILVAAVCAEAALIYSAQYWYKFHTVPTISEAWHKSSKHFWPIFGINILEKFLLSVILAVTVAVLPLIPAGTGGFYATILLVAISVFLALILVLTSIYALGYIVLDSTPAIEAVGAGWKLLTNHLLVSLELTAIIVFFNVIIAWIISLGAVIMLIPSFVVSLVGGVSGLNVLVGFAVGMYMVLFVAFIIALGSFFNTFTTSAWMYLFMKMHHEGLVSRLGHWAKKLTGKS